MIGNNRNKVLKNANFFAKQFSNHCLCIFYTSLYTLICNLFCHCPNPFEGSVSNWTKSIPNVCNPSVLHQKLDIFNLGQIITPALSFITNCQLVYKNRSTFIKNISHIKIEDKDINVFLKPFDLLTTFNIIHNQSGPLDWYQKWQVVRCICIVR